jgi:hypothetical protein
MKIVINACHGGFDLSVKAIDRYIELKGLTLYKEYEGTWKTTSYYTVTIEEYDRVHKADKLKGNYSDSNALCWNYRDIERTDSILIQVVEEMGEEANGKYGELKIVEIPDYVEWQIEEYDGMEWVAEKHRTWC